MTFLSDFIIAANDAQRNVRQRARSVGDLGDHPPKVGPVPLLAPPKPAPRPISRAFSHTLNNTLSKPSKAGPSSEWKEKQVYDNSVIVDESRPHVGLLILGNSGVGKSYLANVILNRQKFKHELRPRSVTSYTENAPLIVGKNVIEVFNIPGLIENDPELISRNKTEIAKAFQQQPFCVICFVFSSQGGRIRNEDVVAFHALDKAYHLERRSLCFVVNDVPAIRCSDYEGETVGELLSIPADQLRVCFCDPLAANDVAWQRKMRSRLLDVLVECIPTKHEKHQNIELHRDEVNKLKDSIASQQAAFDKQVEAFQARIQSLQTSYDTLKNQPPREIHHYHTRVEKTCQYKISKIKIICDSLTGSENCEGFMYPKPFSRTIPRKNTNSLEF